MQNPWQRVLLIIGIIAGLVFVIRVSLVANSQPNEDVLVHMPYVRLDPTPTPTPTPTPKPTPKPPPTGDGNQEFRGIWVTRFDWTTSTGADPAKIDEIVNNAAYAGFNAILFQVRGEADAYYTPGLEPWAERLTGTWGQNPGWDPLASLIQKAHARGIQVHAYMNVYPVILGCSTGPSTNPQHFYYGINSAHGQSGGKLRGLMWNGAGSVVCGTSEYQRASPASLYVDNHLLSVGADLLNRYDLDGLHLDHIRYASGASCDPVSLCRYYGHDENCGLSLSCPLSNGGYRDWQRAQVNGTVEKFFDLVAGRNDGLWLTGAVWPTYIDYWGWGYTEGYHDYFQDSKAWLRDDYIDAIMPMLYSWNTTTDPFRLDRWKTLVADYQNSSAGRYVIPGIGGTAFLSFSQIEARINYARQVGTIGHAIFSYGYMEDYGYFDDLANGPYSQPASVPNIPWHN
jgi:uncharacterized lipoprotein YddW (UPF0748 family)